MEMRILNDDRHQTGNFYDLTPQAVNYRPPQRSLVESQLPEMAGNPLRTLDLFAGCGGLAYGMQVTATH